MAAGTTVDVGALIDRRISPFQFGVLVTCFLIALIDGVDSQVISVTGPAMVSEFGIGRAALGPIFSAAPWGGLVGSMLFGPCADAWGRKRFLIGCSLLCGIATVAMPLATSASGILVLRAVTGFGLGGAGPCFLALATEYAPRRFRAGMVTIIWAALPASGILNGLFGAFVVDDFGWRSIYYGSGAATLVITLAMLVTLPESVSFLVARGADAARIRPILDQLAVGDVDPAPTRFIVNEPRHEGVPVKHLFDEGRATMTILLWLAFIASYFALLATLIWTPGLLKGTGMSTAAASLALTSNNIGGLIGTILIGQLVDRFSSHGALALTFLGGALATAFLGIAAPAFWPVAILSAAAGLLVGGGIGGLIALTALAYPTFMRSTGIGWALGLSRFGSASGPLIVGILVGSAWSSSAIFALLGAMALVVALVIIAMGMQQRRSPAAAAPA
jgi:AAHS family 4-hydroxybenzoate transporter-like MFS transporter